MILIYRICTWTAIAALAFGSVAVFVIFLMTTLRHLRAERKTPAAARSQGNTQPF